MPNNKDFIGMGRNPDSGAPDIPLGLGMALMQESDARKNFENLSNADKTRIISYIQSAASGYDAKHRITIAVDNLKHNNSTFL